MSTTTTTTTIPFTDNELECMVCLQILDNPLIEPSCQQMFCKDCIYKCLNKNDKCPLCNQNCTTDKLSLPPKLILNRLNDYKFKCTSVGCEELLKKSEFKQHMDTCKKVIVSCIGKSELYCTWAGLRENQNDHQLNCNHVNNESLIRSIASQVKNEIENDKLKIDSLEIQRNQNIEYFNYKDKSIYLVSDSNYEIPDNINSVAFGKNLKQSMFHYFSILNPNINEIYLPNDFNSVFQRGDIPDSIKTIHFFNVDRVMDILETPSNITNFHFHDDCTPEIYSKLRGIAKQVHFYTIKNDFLIECQNFNWKTQKRCLPFYPELYFHDGFEYDVNHYIEEGVSTLHLYDIKSPINSIPSNIKSLSFCDGFNHPIRIGLLNKELSELFIHDIKQPLLVGSLPHRSYKLSICNGFKRSLPPRIIPNGLLELHIHNIKIPLIKGSIPNELDILYFHNGYNHSIVPDIIPDGVKILHVFDIKQPLVKDSFPSTLRHIHLHDGFAQELVEGYFTVKPRGIPKNTHLHLFNSKFH